MCNEPAVVIIFFLNHFALKKIILKGQKQVAHKIVNQ